MEEWEKLSPAAILDEEHHQAALREHEAEQRKLDQRKTPPPSNLVTRAQLQKRLDSLVTTIARGVRELIAAPFEKRIRELEQREWVGTWERGKSYSKNALVSHNGSAWVATRDYPDLSPGSGANCGWRLVVKRGKDAR
jgi:hypothetical protein